MNTSLTLISLTRPNNFIAPWVYEARSADAAMSSLVSAVLEVG